MSFYQKISRNLILPLSDLALGTSVSKKLNSLEKSQWWSEQRITTYQNKRLRALVKHSYHSVPYYHRYFRKRNLYPDDVKSVADLKKLPLITKQKIRDNYEDFVSRKVRMLNPIIASTGGTTGQPFQYISSKQSASMLWATNFRGWGWGGYKFGEKRATLAGISLIPNEKLTLKQSARFLLENHLPLFLFHPVFPQMVFHRK